LSTAFIDEANETEEEEEMDEEQISASKAFSDPMKNYRTHEMWINTMHKVIFGDKFDEVYDMMGKCEARIAPHADEDLKFTHKVW